MCKIFISLQKQGLNHVEKLSTILDQNKATATRMSIQVQDYLTDSG